jgi:5'-methylthioadenosine phosphorylase
MTLGTPGTTTTTEDTLEIKDVEIGIIGGSGLYCLENFEIVKEFKVKTPWGFPSDLLIIGKFKGISVAFLPR